MTLLGRSIFHKKCNLTWFNYQNNPYSVCFAASAVARDSRVFRRILEIIRLCLLGYYWQLVANDNKIKNPKIPGIKINIDVVLCRPCILMLSYAFTGAPHTLLMLQNLRTVGLQAPFLLKSQVIGRDFGFGLMLGGKFKEFRACLGDDEPGRAQNVSKDSFSQQ